MVSEIRSAYANTLRRSRPRRGDKWRLDEVYLSMNGRRHYLWRTVDQEGHAFENLAG